VVSEATSWENQDQDQDAGGTDEIGGFESLRRRLLDLTAKNRLLHYPHPRRASLRIIDELPDVLAKRLLDGEALRLIPVPEPTREQLVEAGYISIDPRTGEETQLRPYPDAAQWAKHNGLNTDYELPPGTLGSQKHKHFDDKIQTLFFAPELERQLSAIRQTAERSINESGANVLYLALGW